MMFRAFPFDTQICDLDIESCKFQLNNFWIASVTFGALKDASNAKGIKLHWKEPYTSVGIAEDLMISNFKLIGHKEYTADVVLASGKNYLNRYSLRRIKLLF